MWIVILPWLQISKPIKILGFTLLPRVDAVVAAGELGAHVEAATSYFVENSRVLYDGEGPPQLVPVQPTVVLLGDDELDLSRASLAIDGVFFATMLGNTLTRIANATNFVSMSVWVDVSMPLGGMSLASRTLFGRNVTGTRAELSIETRPFWCGHSHAPNEDALRLFEAVARKRAAKPIIEAIRALYNATHDTSVLDPRLEHASYALVFERLLHRKPPRSGQPVSGQRSEAGSRKRRRKKRYDQQTRILQQNKLAHQLLTQMIRGLRKEPVAGRPGKPLSTALVVRAMKWIRDDRNAQWHADKTASRHLLASQLAVRPNTVAFRVASSLMIASMAELTPDLVTPWLSSYVAATVQWVSELGALRKLPPGDALGRFGELQSYFSIRAGIVMATQRGAREKR